LRVGHRHTTQNQDIKYFINIRPKNSGTFLFVPAFLPTFEKSGSAKNQKYKKLNQAIARKIFALKVSEDNQKNIFSENALPENQKNVFPENGGCR